LEEELILEYWRCFDQADFRSAMKLMEPHCKVLFPNTGERFDHAELFIRMNEAYPGRWRASVERVERCENLVITAVRVSSPETLQSFYAVTFFRLQNGKIYEIVEYWGENGTPPEWRIRGDY
jgi:hypothetical protein